MPSDDDLKSEFADQGGKFPDRPIQFPVRSQKFPVPMRREFPRNSLDLLPYLASLSGSQGSLVTLPSSGEIQTIGSSATEQCGKLIGEGGGSFTASAYWKFESIPLQRRVGRT